MRNIRTWQRTTDSFDSDTKREAFRLAFSFSLLPCPFLLFRLYLYPFARTFKTICLFHSDCSRAWKRRSVLLCQKEKKRRLICRLFALFFSFLRDSEHFLRRPTDRSDQLGIPIQKFYNCFTWNAFSPKSRKTTDIRTKSFQMQHQSGRSTRDRRYRPDGRRSQADV